MGFFFFCMCVCLIRFFDYVAYGAILVSFKRDLHCSQQRRWNGRACRREKGTNWDLGEIVFNLWYKHINVLYPISSDTTLLIFCNWIYFDIVHNTHTDILCASGNMSTWDWKNIIHMCYRVENTKCYKYVVRTIRNTRRATFPFAT